MVFAETDRLRLRSWTSADIPLLAAMNADPLVMKFFPCLMTYAETEALYNRIQDELKQKAWGIYAVERRCDGMFIGFVGLHEIGFESFFTPGVEISWRLASPYHRMGFATEAAKAVLELAKLHGLKKIYSFTSVLNISSENVMQKIGMIRIGEFNHPALTDKSPLQRHVLYQIDL